MGLGSNVYIYIYTHEIGVYILVFKREIRLFGELIKRIGSKKYKEDLQRKKRVVMLKSVESKISFQDNQLNSHTCVRILFTYLYRSRCVGPTQLLLSTIRSTKFVHCGMIYLKSQIHTSKRIYI